MSDALERAARAVSALNECGDEDCWPAYLADVKAVLRAIREPSEAMVNRGGVGFTREWTDPWDGLSPDERSILRLDEEPVDYNQSAAEAVRPHVLNTWQAMIDAALGALPAQSDDTPTREIEGDLS